MIKPSDSLYHLNEPSDNGHAPALFRAEAMQHYWQARQTAVLPRYLAPRTFLYVWALLLLACLVAITVLFVRVPILVSGAGIVTNTQPDVTLMVLVPAVWQPQLQAGQAVWVHTQSSNKQWRASVTAVHPDILSPRALQMQFDNAGDIIHEPTSVLWATYMPADNDNNIHPALYNGSRYAVTIEVGSHPLIALVPFLGSFFEEGGHSS